MSFAVAGSIRQRLYGVKRYFGGMFDLSLPLFSGNEQSNLPPDFAALGYCCTPNPLVFSNYQAMLSTEPFTLFLKIFCCGIGSGHKFLFHRHYGREKYGNHDCQDHRRGKINSADTAEPDHRAAQK